MRFQLLAKGDFIKHHRTAKGGSMRRWKSKESLQKSGPATKRGLVRINQVIEEMCRKGVYRLRLEYEGLSSVSSAFLEKITVSLNPCISCPAA